MLAVIPMLTFLALPQVEEARLANGVPGLGWNVAVEGDTAVVSQHVGQGPGRVFVFVRSGTGWAEEQELVPSLPVTGDNWGVALDVAGDTVVAAANFEAGFSGRVFVFERNGTAWTETQVLQASDSAPDTFFGDSLSLDGERLVVGAGDALVGGQHRGAAYVFERSGSGWIETQKLVPSDPTAGFFFGWSVSLAGDLLLAGRPATSAGEAHVFRRVAGSWTPEAVLVASDGAAGDLFGWSVSLHGTTALVGGHGHDAGGTSAGAAWVFAADGTAWSQAAKLVADDAASGDELGRAAWLGADVAVLGAAQDDDAGTSSGAAYVFERDGTAWSQAAKLVASDAEAGDELGTSVVGDGERLVVGAPGADAAYVFTLVEPECWLVLGTGTDTAPFRAGGHTFLAQVGRVVEHHAVLLDAIPDFVLPFATTGGPPAAGHERRGDLADPRVPVDFWAQVLMWNPEVFPDEPEQWTSGVRARVWPGGALSVRHYGHSTGMEILPELGVDARGRSVLRFPFTIPGL